jgi:hypothetical protein
MTSTFTRRLARLRVPLGFACGAIVLWFAQPHWWSLVVGGLVACMGEGLRVWAAGHLEKSREVTRSGPYRWLRHPLYVGSFVMSGGLAIACWSVLVALFIAAYMVATITAAVRTENAFLRDTFGNDYHAWRTGEVSGASSRRFSFERAARNREYRAVLGLAAGFALLALKVWRLGE